MDSKIKLLILKYIKATLTDDDAACLSAWLSEDKMHGVEFRDEIRALSEENVTTIDAVKFWADFEGKNHRILYGKNARSTKLVRWAASVALSVAVSVAVAISFIMSNEPMEINEVEFTEMIQPVEIVPVVETKEQLYVADSVSRVILADGTRVVLNKGARLEVSSSFGTSLREVNLDGEAFFDVARDTSRLFVVNCGRGRFIVRGTSFNISSYSAEKMALVTLHTGSLEARIQGNIIRLTPGDELMIDESSNNYSKRIVENVQDSKSWIDSDRIVFNDQPLKLVAVRIAKKYGVKFVVDSSIENIIYTGQIYNEPLDQILRLLEVTSYVPIKITKAGTDEYYIDKI